jgi:hypothetical protein
MKTAKETRFELLAAITRLSQLQPDWRLGQTLANLATTAGRLDAGGVWELEDEEALDAARMLIEQSSATEAEDVRLGAGIGADRASA